MSPEGVPGLAAPKAAPKLAEQLMRRNVTPHLPEPLFWSAPVKADCFPGGGILEEEREPHEWQGVLEPDPELTLCHLSCTVCHTAPSWGCTRL